MAVNTVESMTQQIEYWMEASANAHWSASLQMKLADNAKLAGDEKNRKLFLDRASTRQREGHSCHDQMQRVLTRLVNPIWRIYLAEYIGDGVWIDSTSANNSPLDFDSEGAANDHVALLESSKQAAFVQPGSTLIGATMVREVRKVYA